ncbi:MAG: hypothetical protein ACOZQL_21815 [Myxococcota bacterium]
MWSALVVSLFFTSTPPQVSGAEPPPPPPPPLDLSAPPPPPTPPPATSEFTPPRAPRTKPSPPPLPPARLALFFAPLSGFALTLWLEADLHLASGVSLFANVGGGPLGQLGGDAGLRYYIGGSPFEGFSLDARASVFSLPAQGLVMMGPGLQLQHGWRVGSLAISVGLGFTTWYGLERGSQQPFFGATPTDADVIVFPGLSQPPVDRPGVQPTVRLSLGPTF